VEKLGDKLGQRIVVENMPGAGGINAANTVRAQRPDGYTLALVTNGTAVSVGLFESLPFDPVKDFAPVSSIGYFDFLFCVNATSPFKTLADVLKAAREKPGSLNIGTINIGSTQNLTAELLKSTAKIDVTLVPYRTSPEVLVGLLRDDVQLAIDSYAAVKSQLTQNKIRAIATSAPTPSAVLPNVAPAKDSDLAGFEVVSWNAFFVKTGTSPEIIATLNKSLHEVLGGADLKQRALDMGIELRAGTPEEIAARLRADIEQWTKVIERAGVPKQ
jgi:putative tricarboxylic transport membrane protein